MRRRVAEKRSTSPDPKFKSQVVGKFINIVMLCGKKSIAMDIVYDCLEVLEKRLKEDPVEIFNKALDNSRPRLMVKSRRIGGATYQVPVEIVKDKGLTIAMRWIRDIARSKKGRSMSLRLADELGSAYKNEGLAIKKKSDAHKMAESNRAFAQFKY